MLEQHLQEIFTRLNTADVRYIVVGGVAVAAHGHPRMTADLDLVVALDPANARAAITALDALGYRPLAPVAALQFADADVRQRWVKDKGMLVFQLRSESRPETCIDLFVEEPFNFDDEYARAPRMELVDGCTCPVVHFETLLALKRRAGRPQDLEDIRNLEIGRNPPPPSEDWNSGP